MRPAVVTPDMIRDLACSECNDYVELRRDKWRHVTTKPYPDLHDPKPVAISELTCYCDKMGFIDWDRALADDPAPPTDREKVAYCMCHQRCYAPSVCAACGIKGCRGGISQQRAYALMQESFAEAIEKARRKITDLGIGEPK